MEFTRRNFLKFSSSMLAGATLGADLSLPRKADAHELSIANGDQTKTICPYCAVGYGVIVYTTKNGKS